MSNKKCFSWNHFMGGRNRLLLQLKHSIPNEKKAYRSLRSYSKKISSIGTSGTRKDSDNLNDWLRYIFLFCRLLQIITKLYRLNVQSIMYGTDHDLKKHPDRPLRILEQKKIWRLSSIITKTNEKILLVWDLRC